LAAPSNSSLLRRSDNAVQKISEPEAMSNARRNINRMVAPGLGSFRLFATAATETGHCLHELRGDFCLAD
jgi:hypothetical protein